MTPENPITVSADVSAFSTARFRAVEITESNVDVLQCFFDENPQYFLATGGAPPRANEAIEEIHDVPPFGYPYSRILILLWQDGDGRAAAQATLVFDLFAERVLHIGLFIAATAQACHASIERVAREHGYQWLRLGVVAGNARAERFWERRGYVQTRVREGVEMGMRTQTVRVMIKPLGTETVAEYLTKVPRDQPGQP
ncbi:MAG: GNAT family N-acetyltransferase [Betaproteobacteria bacterium]|nr:GNAT family N-acetyltransferase [Betaproteobacteria bacterium]